MANNIVTMTDICQSILRQRNQLFTRIRSVYTAVGNKEFISVGQMKVLINFLIGLLYRNVTEAEVQDILARLARDEHGRNCKLHLENVSPNIPQ